MPVQVRQRVQINNRRWRLAGSREGAMSHQRVLAFFIVLCAAARAAPGKLTYGHAGIGTVPHLSVEALVWKADIRVVPVAFRGDAQMVPQLLSGQIDFGAAAVSTIAQQDPRVLAVFGDKRHSAYPGAPVVTELGYPYMPPGLNGLFAAKATPERVLARLERSCAQAAEAEKFRKL